MAEVDLVLQVHGEVTDPAVDVFDREARFIDTVLAPLAERHPRLRIVFEHITTRAAVRVRARRPRRRRRDRDAAAPADEPQRAVRRRHPPAPLLPAGAQGRARTARALLDAIASGTPRFFLGTDSAPHARRAKENACGCAGIFSAHAGIELYAEVFEAAGALEQARGLRLASTARTSTRLPRNRDSVTLVKEAWEVPAQLPVRGR